MAQGTQSVTIAAGASLSGAIEIGERATALMLVMPDQWTAAGLTVQTSPDGVTYQNLYDRNGTEVAIVTAASRNVALDTWTFGGARYIKLRSGTAGTPVNQAGARSIQVVCRPV